jgi:ribonuclease-3
MKNERFTTNDFKKSDDLDDSDDEIFDLSKPHISRDEIKTILSTGLPEGSFMRPKNLEFYRRSLVHKSLQKSVRHAQYNKREVQSYMIESNERIEFLGDAVLNLVAANVLYDKYPDKDEGFMTRMRTKIVRDKQCARFAKVLGLQNHILTGNKVVRVKDSDGKITNGKLLEDAFESFIGAIYKDLGFNSAESFIVRLINNHVDFSSLLIDDNYKDILMRYSQAFDYELPVYETVSVDGPPHSRKFVISVSLYRKGTDISTKREFGLGEGSSKKASEQRSAQNSMCNCKIVNCKKIHMKELEGIIDRDH